MTTIPATVAAAAERFGAAEALVDGDERWSFAELDRRVTETARAFVASGVEPGDRVAIWAHNCAEWLLAALGTQRAGGVVVPLNTRFKGSEAAYVLEASGAKVLCTVTDFLGTDYVSMLPPGIIDEIVVLQGPELDGTVKFSDLLARAGDQPLPEVGPDDLCAILFTSGTTGKPKGAMLRHGAAVQAFTAWSDVVGLAEGDRYLIVNPFFHAFGLFAGILASLLKGATIVPHPVFDVPSVMARVAEERITMLPGPPTVYQSILDHPDRAGHDLSTLRLAVTGAAVVPVEMIRRMRDELTFRTIVTGYGLTEATGIATMCRHDDDPETIATTAGRAIPGVEVRVDDATGEVLVRGYNVMAGYFGNPEATAEAIDAEGWLHTGDVGTMDDAGNLRITDRLKDMFITGGFNAYPAEIEQLLLRHPGISQVAVVGVPDHRMGEVGKAFVVARPGATLDPDELVTWSRAEMANYKVPRIFVVVDVLPTNASGKVLKFELRGGA